MRDSEGKIVAYIGQPWLNPTGTLLGKNEETFLLIETPAGVVLTVKDERYAVSSMSYEEYLLWRKDFSGVPKKEKVHSEEYYDRFDIMEIDDN